MQHFWLSLLWVSLLICSRRLPFKRRHAETGVTRKAVCLRLKARGGPHATPERARRKGKRPVTGKPG